MKRLILFVLLFVAKNNYAQQIIAGSYGPWDNYHDYIPDTAIYISASSGTDSLPLDINGDGTNDVILFHIYHAAWNWGHERTFGIMPLAGAQIAYGETDSCISIDNLFAYVNGYAKAFDINNVIDNSATWVDTALVYYKSKADPTQPTGTVAGYNCFHTTVWGPMAPFFGVRIFTPDTLYGWIKPKVIPGNGMNDDTLFIDSYACQTSLTGIHENFSASGIQFSPNPSSGIFSSSAILHDAEMMITDMTGRVVMERRYENERPVIDLSAYENGIYFVKVSEGKKYAFSKLILAK